MDAEAYPGNDYSFLEELRALWQQEYSIKASIVLTTYNMKQVVEKTLCGLIFPRKSGYRDKRVSWYNTTIGGMQ
jgi:hypothetical protein